MPKGRVLEPFSSETEYRFCTFWSETWLFHSAGQEFGMVRRSTRFIMIVVYL